MMTNEAVGEVVVVVVVVVEWFLYVINQDGSVLHVFMHEGYLPWVLIHCDLLIKVIDLIFDLAFSAFESLYRATFLI